MSKIKKIIKDKFSFIYIFYTWMKKNVKLLILYLKLVKKILSQIKIKLSTRLHRKPRELQLPITYKCNFDCVMCGMRTLMKNEDFTYQALEDILKDKLFNKVISVGVNGGEPFLKKDLDEYIKVIVDNLPKLKNIYIITNGYFTNTILEKLQVIKKICNSKNVKLNVSISIDGIGELQDMHRGNIHASKTSFSTVEKIMKNQKLYCDNINIITTITKSNIYNINEVYVWAKTIGITVNYNIATIHRRINNDYKYPNFSIFTDEHARMLAEEFFYSLFYETKSQRYFAIYLYIKERIRYSQCNYQYNGVTLTPNSQLLYCATFSDELGNAKEEKPSKLFYKNYKYKYSLIKEMCSECSHYIYTLSPKGFIKYIKEMKKII